MVVITASECGLVRFRQQRVPPRQQKGPPSQLRGPSKSYFMTWIKIQRGVSSCIQCLLVGICGSVEIERTYHSLNGGSSMAHCKEAQILRPADGIKIVFPLAGFIIFVPLVFRKHYRE